MDGEFVQVQKFETYPCHDNSWMASFFQVHKLESHQFHGISLMVNLFKCSYSNTKTLSHALLIGI